jgi:hypothetical protein
MTEHLCVIDGCTDMGQHEEGCDSQKCRGCRPRIAERPSVCEPDRRGLHDTLTDIATYHAQLSAEQDLADLTAWTARIRPRLPVPTTNPARLAKWTEGSWATVDGHDPVLTATPAGPIGRSNQRRVSGSRHAPIPANLHQLDLTAQARQGSRAPHARGVLGLDKDQIGHLSIATELDTWVRDWREQLFADQHLPVPTVTTLVAWLQTRLGDACDRHEDIDEFAADIRQLRQLLHGALQLGPARKELCPGVACRSCDRVALYRDGAAVQCGWCRQYYSEREYTDWVALLDADAKRRGLRAAERIEDRPERTQPAVRVGFPQWVADACRCGAPATVHIQETDADGRSWELHHCGRCFNVKPAVNTPA